MRALVKLAYFTRFQSGEAITPRHTCAHMKVDARIGAVPLRAFLYKDEVLLTEKRVQIQVMMQSQSTSLDQYIQGDAGP